MSLKKNYSVRLGITYLFFCSLFFIIIVRLYCIQVLQQDFFKNIIAHQYVIDHVQPVTRGFIYDRNHELLAFNTSVFSAFVMPFKTACNKQTLDFLKSTFPDVYNRIQQDHTKKFLWVARHLSNEQLTSIRDARRSDIYLIEEVKRFYPHTFCASIVGAVNIDNHGSAGIELAYDTHLCGTPTSYEVSKDARSELFYFQRTLKEKGNDGRPITLTLDHILQFFVSEELKKTVEQFHAKKAACVIVDPQSGELLSVANYPSFNPNLITNKDIEHMKTLAIHECYELGSVIKTFSGLAALAEGVVSPDELIDCEGKYTYIGKFKVENWKKLYVLPFREVVRQSSNVGIAKVMGRLKEKLYDHLRKVGFGTIIDIPFHGLRSGFVNHPKNWSKYSPLVLSFGYEITGSLLHLAKAFSIIANGGYDVSLSLIKGEKGSEKKGRIRLYDEEVIKTIKEILRDPQTLFSQVKKEFPLPGYTVMGKTGTARLLVDGEYSSHHHIYTFAGIVEKGDYQRVIITFVQEPEQDNMWASEISAPLFQRIAERAVIHDLLSEASDSTLSNMTTTKMEAELTLS